MRSRYAALISVALILISWEALSARQNSPEKYKIDTPHSAIMFRTKHMNVSYTYGRFDEFEGTITLDEADLTKSSFQVEIKANSIDTNDAGRDKHLKSPDFFNVKQFPKITFKSTQVKVAGQQFEITGDLTLLGVTKPITATLERVGTGPGMQGEYRTGFDGVFSLKRSDFGMNYGLDNLSDEIMIHVGFEGIRQ